MARVLAWALTLLCLMGAASMDVAQSRWKPEYAGNTPEVQAWFRSAIMTFKSARRLQPLLRANQPGIPERPLTQKDYDWLQQQSITDETHARFLREYEWAWLSCCNHSDRVKTLFYVDRATGEDHWKYYDAEANTWVEIPPDTVHDDDPSMPSDLKREGVLFMHEGVVTCFYPPQGGF